MSLTNTATALSHEPDSEGQHVSDHGSPSRMDEEGEVSDLECTGPDPEELLNVDMEVSVEQTYRETIRGVRSFMGWKQVPEFDSSSSS